LGAYGTNKKEKTFLLSAPTALALSFIEMTSFFFFVRLWRTPVNLF